MLSKIFAWFLIIIFSPLRMGRFLLALSLPLLLVGCPEPCPVCPSLAITLPVEQAPLLRRVDALTDGDRYCLSDRARRDLLIDIELLKQFGYINMTIIEKFNASHKEP